MLGVEPGRLGFRRESTIGCAAAAGNCGGRRGRRVWTSGGPGHVVVGRARSVVRCVPAMAVRRSHVASPGAGHSDDDSGAAARGGCAHGAPASLIRTRPEHRAKIHSTKPLERLDGEVKRVFGHDLS